MDLRTASLIVIIWSWINFINASIPPNVIIFMADDLGYNDLGSFGSVTINTPNIDQLSLEGMKLTQFYSTAALCSGSRSALLTGRLPQRTGVYSNYSYPRDLQYRVFYPSSIGSLPSTELTIANFLSDKGYYNKIIGKWHLGHNNALPTKRGFQSFLGLPYSHEEGFPGPNPEALVYPPVPLIRDETIIRQPFNMSDLQIQYNSEALAFLRNISNHSNKAMNQPFFLYMAYEQPHVPLFESWNSSQNMSRRGLYGDVVAEMDTSIGLIMNKLKELKLSNNTFVMFSSDNGAWINPSSGFGRVKDSSSAYTFDGGSNAPNRGGKGSTWEGGSHVPAIFWMPGTIPAYSSCQSPMTNMDVLPTLADMVGFKLPNDRVYDGTSVLRYVTELNECNNRMSDPHNFTYYWRSSDLYAIRYYQFKAHWITRNGFGEKPPVHHSPPILYNIEWDPAESIALNTSGNSSEYAMVLQILEKEYVRAKNEILNDIGYPMFNDQDYFVQPCCDKGFNWTQAQQFYDDGEIGLAIWDECVCNLKP